MVVDWLEANACQDLDSDYENIDFFAENTSMWSVLSSSSPHLFSPVCILPTLSEQEKHYVS